MKKLISLLLVAVMLAAMAACNNTPVQSNGEPAKEPEATPSITASDELTEADPIEDVLPKGAELFVYAGGDGVEQELNFKVGFNGESKLATEDDVKEYKESIENLKLADIKRFYACAVPSLKEKGYKLEITEEQYKSLLGAVKELEVKPIEEIIPATGGGWYCYIETADTAYLMFHNGDMLLSVAQQGKEKTIIFKCDDILSTKIMIEMQTLIDPPETIPEAI